MTTIERYDAAMTLVQAIGKAALEKLALRLEREQFVEAESQFSIAQVQEFAKQIVALTGRKRGEPKKRAKKDKGNGDA